MRIPFLLVALFFASHAIGGEISFPSVFVREKQEHDGIYSYTYRIDNANYDQAIARIEIGREKQSDQCQLQNNFLSDKQQNKSKEELYGPTFTKSITAPIGWSSILAVCEENLLWFALFKRNVSRVSEFGTYILPGERVQGFQILVKKRDPSLMSTGIKIESMPLDITSKPRIQYIISRPEAISSEFFRAVPRIKEFSVEPKILHLENFENQEIKFKINISASTTNGEKPLVRIHDIRCKGISPSKDGVSRPFLKNDKEALSFTGMNFSIKAIPSFASAKHGVQDCEVEVVVSNEVGNIISKTASFKIAMRKSHRCEERGSTERACDKDGKHDD